MEPRTNFIFGCLLVVVGAALLLAVGGGLLFSPHHDLSSLQSGGTASAPTSNTSLAPHSSPHAIRGTVSVDERPRPGQTTSGGSNPASPGFLLSLGLPTLCTGAVFISYSREQQRRDEKLSAGIRPTESEEAEWDYEIIDESE